MTGASASPGATTLNRALFLRPIAHRGLHSRKLGRIENSAPAFLAAIDKGYGIECDLQAAKDGAPMVFHDEKLERLFAARGWVCERLPAELARLSYRGQSAGTSRGMLSFTECLRLIAGRVPLLAEVKRNRDPAPKAFLERIAADAVAYRGPLALMSFDRDVLARVGRLAPGVPRGWIVGNHQLAARWWAAPRSAGKARAVARLLATAPKGMAFFAVDVRILGGARAFVEHQGLTLPLFSWTIRTRREQSAAARWADAPIFEGYEA